MKRQHTRSPLAMCLLLLAGIGTAHAEDTPRILLRPGVWQHSALDAQGRPDPAGMLTVCESSPSHADLWRSIAREEQGEGCGPRRMGWRNGQITVEQTCTEDADTVVTRTTMAPVKAEDGSWTAYRTTSTRTVRNRQGRTLATATEVSLHAWLRTCALRDEGQTALPTTHTPEAKTR